MGGMRGLDCCPNAAMAAIRSTAARTDRILILPRRLSWQIRLKMLIELLKNDLSFEDYTT
jgi:hypothetical protein